MAGTLFEGLQVYSVRTKRRSAPFLKGPIPLDWLQKAAELGGAALEAGVMLWYRHGLSKGQPFKLANHEATLSGKSENSGRRALHSLEQAGLIHIEALPGRKKTITIITKQTEKG